MKGVHMNQSTNKWKLPPLPWKIPEDKIGLPTRGATITKCTLLHEGEKISRPEPFAGFRPVEEIFPADAYRVEGVIHSMDPNAPDIRFEAGLPLDWNGKLLQQGGGGLDGYVPFCASPLHGQSDGSQSALKQGYLVIGSDSGHGDVNGNVMQADFAVNQEAFENFAHLSLKKVKDVGVELARMIYGQSPGRVYFYGGSNGGRECMKAIQIYPEDYDGAVCFYPVLYWVQKVLLDARNELAMEKAGTDGFIDQEKDAKIYDTILKACSDMPGSEDGLISDIKGVREKRPEIEEALGEFLSTTQMELLTAFDQPIEMPWPLAYENQTFPGYPVFEGTSAFAQFIGPMLSKRFGMMTGTDSALANIIAQDPSYNLLEKGLDINGWKDRILEVSEWLDACDVNLDGFIKRNGKLILVQGTTDPQVSMHGTMQYVEKLRKHYGTENAENFMKFYLAPGYGHGDGKFMISADFIRTLDKWVEEEKAPGAITVTDKNPETAGRRRLLEPV